MSRGGNLVLIGFMGVGKSAVGRELARLLGWALVETDDFIERAAGRSIAEIFAADGEAAFRSREARAVRGLAGLRRTVIVTGGGAPLDPANQRRLRWLGQVVRLTAALDAIVRRTRAGTPACARPLLAGLDRSAAADRIRDLLAAREPAYAIADVAFDTTADLPPTVARAIAAWARLAPVGDSERVANQGPASPAKPDRPAARLTTPPPYPVVCGPGALANWPAHAGVAADAVGPRRSCLLVTDPLVGALWGRVAADAAADAGLAVTVAHVPRGEAAKRGRVLEDLWRRMLDAGLGRDGLVAALGGGAVGDVAGLAAATYMRGIDYVQLPTTLLAQVDSAVGGKTAVNVGRHKNSAGAFWDPAAVVADQATLTSLPVAQLRSGLAEALKYGLIYDAALWHDALAWGRGLAAPDAPGASGAPGGPNTSTALEGPALTDLIRTCLGHKAAVVAADRREAGPRAALNFGHTLGHAVEGLGRGRLAHGRAVAAGMEFAAYLGERLGVTEPGTRAEIEAGLRSVGLCLRRPPGGPADWLRLIQGDKKNRGGQIRFVLLRRLGEVLPDLAPITTEALARALADWAADRADGSSISPPVSQG